MRKRRRLEVSWPGKRRRRSSLLEIVEVFGSDKKEKCESIRFLII